MSAYIREDDHIRASVDWVIILLYLGMVLAGWFSIYASSYQFDSGVTMFDLSGRAGKQLVFFGFSAVVAFIILKLDSNIFDVFAYFIYAFFIGLLILTIFIAKDIKGSRSWIVITDSINIQSAEFAKFAVALALARFMNRYNFKLMTFKNLSAIAGLIILPMLLIFLQKETGSALVYTAFVLMLYREGLPGMVLVSGLCAIAFFVIGLRFSDVELGFVSLGELLSIIIMILISACLVFNYKKDRHAAKYIILGLIGILGLTYILSLFIPVPWGIAIAVAIVALITYLLVLARKHWSMRYVYIVLFVIGGIAYVSSVDYVFTKALQPHQQKRILVSLGMKDDPSGAGYNVNQSKIAIGSGGLLGKGFLHGTQTKLKYVPEQDTDFIFCTVGEERGFVGSVIVVLGFLVLILRLIYLSERQKNTFGRVYGYCVAAIFLFHLTINIGMVIGLTPVIGIPLPFFSYGGSSLLGFTILLFIFLRIDMTRKRR
ncbi:rod shape-determining protein RodA [Dysgonomonas sp. 520]|uniref:rod shape-determining protein RodA n=1 Tax=Dysgonomonas sp. 520 TaxID=2302931 RepID=UPI0013D37CAB|nr:rod shape-determining protein RodA [Dysgonomonas sp. 520]NDW09385.1 rod shape-determining protein RodA [Dysgonomonas sp. 520]